MLVSKNPKMSVTSKAKPKTCITPNANQWNIGRVGKIVALAMYISFFFVSISFALGLVFQWNMGFKIPKVTFNLEAPANTRKYLPYSSYLFPFVWSGISV